MKAAPYNPETLKRIRAGATRHELGWDERFYSSVCGKHGIQPVFSVSKVDPEAHAKREAAMAAAEVERLKALNAFVFDPFSCEVRQADCIAILTRRQAEIFNVLAQNGNGPLLSGPHIASKIGTSRRGCMARLFKMRPKLRQVGMTIDGTKGPGGGFRLIDTRTGEAADVHILRSNLAKPSVLIPDRKAGLSK